MRDTLLASSSLGSLYNNYQWTVNISGSSTVPSPYGVFPDSNGFEYIGLNIVDNTTRTTLANPNWSYTLGNGGKFIFSGTISGVAANDSLYMQLDLQVGAGSGTNAVGQSSYAYSDYSHTVLFNLDALTPGANTVGSTGFDYATPVPVPGSYVLMMSGLGMFGFLARRRNRVVA